MTSFSLFMAPFSASAAGFPRLKRRAGDTDAAMRGTRRKKRDQMCGIDAEAGQALIGWLF